MRSLLLSLLLLCLAACQPHESVGPQPVAFFELVDPAVVSLTALHGPPPSDGSSGPFPVSSTFTASVVDAGNAMGRLMHESETTEDADAALRAYLALPHPDASVQAWREIAVASSFLPGHLINNKRVTPERQEAIAFYATLLIENRQLGGDKVTKALDRLEGYWPEAKLAEARQLVDDAALYVADASPP